jgi:hypothetical protein
MALGRTGRFVSAVGALHAGFVAHDSRAGSVELSVGAVKYAAWSSSAIGDVPVAGGKAADGESSALKLSHTCRTPSESTALNDGINGEVDRTVVDGKVAERGEARR